MTGAVGARLRLACRLLLGTVFFAAGLLKVIAPAEEFAYAIESYKVLPAWAALAASYTLPWAEILIGALLIAGLRARAAALAAGGLLLLFEGLLLSAIVRKLPVTACGCFGSAFSAPPPVEFAMNLLLLGAVFWIACRAQGAVKTD